MAESATTNPKLQEIPLPTVEEQMDKCEPQTDGGKMMSKTGSLKRFFKMNKKGELTPNSKGDSKSKEGGENDGSDEAPNEGDPLKAKSEKSKDQPKRFHLRLGSMSRYDVNSDGNLDSPSSSANTASRMSLKSSLSSYWSNIFKRHPNKKSDADAAAPALNEGNEANTVSEEQEEDEQLQEIVQTLTLSEENEEIAKN